MGSKCEPCNAECNGCTGGTNTACIQCRNNMNGEECVSTCPNGTYADSTTSQCLSCHKNCRDCFGPLETNCTTCRYMEVKTSSGSIVCGDDCFIGWEYTIEDRKCVPTTEFIIVVCVVGGVILLLLILVVIILICCCICRHPMKKAQGDLDRLVTPNPAYHDAMAAQIASDGSTEKI